uniref:Uncharacterized protein n=1 Tax=Rhizophagus irregularis (strain DAOM 181602 / DAOM 197198 / MUCL 43194) TaxID=747089 RepID=U9U4B9_RHIID
MSAKCLSGNGTLVKYLFDEIASVKWDQAFRYINQFSDPFGKMSYFSGNRYRAKDTHVQYVGKSQCTETIPF